MILTTADLAQCRADQESIMTGTCTIDEWDGVTKTYDPATKTEVPALGDRIYPTGGGDGRCLAQALAVFAGQQTTAGGQQVSASTYAVKLPYDVTTVTIGDLITLTVSQDPDLPAVRLVVGDVQGNEYATARRLVCTRLGA